VRARIALALLVFMLTAPGCGSSSTPPPSLTIAPIEARPAGAQEVTTAPAAGNAHCDREASLRPEAQPRPGDMPPGSTMAAIAERGRLVVGVDQNTYPFGFRNPSSGQLEGFDIDLAREIARRIFGDPDRIDLRVVDASQRESALQSGQVDLVVRTYSITCDRKRNVAFSTPYYYANQRVLALRGSGIDSAAALSGKRVCAVRGTTSLSALFALDPRPTLFSVSTWTDCLVMLQQGQVDAISTDDVVLSGLASQDPNVEVVGPSIGVEPYGVGIRKENSDLVRFVNGALDEMRADGTWERLYDARLQSLGPSPGPPAARYQD
jgi:polar amino acid transport system substrate-binding protein